jgi:hypothetical protein
MPGFDGTGPEGLGPMTGCGQGYCIIPIENREDIQNRTPRREKSDKLSMVPHHDPSAVTRKADLRLRPCFWNPIRHRRIRRITHDFSHNVHWKRYRFTH